jgi:hypothetical protein
MSSKKDVPALKHEISKILGDNFGLHESGFRIQIGNSDPLTDPLTQLDPDTKQRKSITYYRCSSEEY